MKPDDHHSKKNIDQVRDHEFDGIQEYDNALPRWWLWLFLLSIAFTPVYLAYYHFGAGKSLQAELAEDLSHAAKITDDAAVNSAAVDHLAMSKDPVVVAAGMEAYTVNCLPCHGQEGQGGIGANLTDRFWIHGGSAEAIHKTIAEGVADKGMPPWLPVLGVDKVNAVTAFVLTLKNTNAANGKAAQGQEEE